MVGCCPCLRHEWWKRRAPGVRIRPHGRGLDPAPAAPADDRLHHAGHIRPVPLDVASPDGARAQHAAGGGPRDVRPSRSDAAMASTPSGPAKAVYRFYCPLCMLYFKSIHRMSCCGQHACSFCFADYCRGRGFRLPPVDHQPAVQLPAGMSCPCCSASGPGLRLELVEPGEPPRSYEDSPRTRANMPPIAESLLSPIKVGDSFDAMRRKMLTFEAAGYYEAAAGGGGPIFAARAERSPSAASQSSSSSAAGGAPSADDGGLVGPGAALQPGAGAFDGGAPADDSGGPVWVGAAPQPGLAFADGGASADDGGGPAGAGAAPPPGAAMADGGQSLDLAARAGLAVGAGPPSSPSPADGAGPVVAAVRAEPAVGSAPSALDGGGAPAAAQPSQADVAASAAGSALQREGAPAAAAPAHRAAASPLAEARVGPAQPPEAGPPSPPGRSADAAAAGSAPGAEPSE